MKDKNIIEFAIQSSKDHLYNMGRNPQSYYSHCIFSIKNSSILILGGVLGVIHGLFPFLFQFNTSTIVVQSFKKLVDSNRHKKELQDIMPEGYILKKHIA